MLRRRNEAHDVETKPRWSRFSQYTPLDTLAPLHVRLLVQIDLEVAELRELAHRLSWRGPGPTRQRFLNVFMDQNNKCNLRCQMCGFSDPRVASIGKYDM